MAVAVVDTPIGPVGLESDGEALVRVGLPGQVESFLADDEPDEVLAKAVREMQQYFRGTRQRFTVPICIEGTVFQEDAWQALMNIPYGETRSYQDQASAIGRPGAARAIGQANRNNRLPIVIPCHRVVRADGALGGYAGDDDDMARIKASLLRLEGAIA